MPALATVVVVWAAVYGYMSAYYGLLYARRPQEREHLSFGLLAGALSIYSAGNAAFLSATTAKTAAIAQTIGALGVILGLTFYVDFGFRVGATPSRVPRVAFGWAILALGALGAGWVLDVRTIARPASLGFGALPEALEAAISPLGVTLLSIGLAITGYGTYRLLPAARRSEQVRLVLVSGTMVILALTHDTFVRVAGLRSMYLAEHLALVGVMAMNYVLLDRFVRTSDALRARTQELGKSYDELRWRQKQLVQREQLAAVGELSAVIAHEVRNPLAIIKNAISGLRRPSLPEVDRRTLVGILEEETLRLHRLARDLLAYARPTVPREQSVNIGALVRSAVEHALLSRKDPSAVDLRLELDGAPDELFGDPDLLRHAVLNIVDNALQAMPNGGTLTVRARADASHDESSVAIGFSDTGEGMGKDVREKARDPFFTTRPSGTGLGLAIVERVVRNHGGSLVIESEPGCGSTVTIVLPERRAEEGRDMANAWGGR